MVSINSISFDLTDFKQHEGDAHSRLWINDRWVATALQFYEGPPAWTFDLTDLDCTRKFFTEQSASMSGAMLSMDVIKPDGLEVLRGLFKYWSPQQGSMGKAYVGILWIPFSNFWYQINVEAMELGQTGLREGCIAMLEPEASRASAINLGPIEVSSGQELFSRMRATPLRAIVADEERFDEKFPQHPLSMVRARLKTVADSLTIDKTIRSQLFSFRLRH